MTDGFPQFETGDGRTHLPWSVGAVYPTLNSGENVGWLHVEPGVGVFYWDGSVWVATGGGGGGGDMFKATYDTDNNGIVDKAEQLEGPAGLNISTAAAVAGHIASTANPHGVTAAQVGAPPDSRQIATANSLTGGGDLTGDRTLELVNDAASPGANQVYGTDGAGAKGWKADPVSGVPAGRLLNTTNPVKIDAGNSADLSADRTLSLETTATDRLLGRDSAGGGAVEEIGVTGGIEFDGAGNIRRGALTGPVTAAAGSPTTVITPGAITVTELATNAVTETKILDGEVKFAKIQDASGAQKLLGRGGGAGAGDFEEITIGAGLKFTGTVLSRINILTADIDDNQVTNAKLRDSAALSVIGNPTNATADPQDIAASVDNYVLRRSGTSIGFGAIAASVVGPGGTDPGFLAQKTSGTPAYTSTPAAGQRSYILRRGAGSDLSFANYGGTTFPSSPVEGMWFWHDTHGYGYRYNATAGGWLSDCVFEMHFHSSTNISATNYCYMGYPVVTAGGVLFTNARGPVYGFALKCVGMSVLMGSSGTATFDVTSGGTAVTGAQVVLTSVIGNYNETLLSNTIAAGSVLGAKVTSGTGNATFYGVARFRRFET